MENLKSRMKVSRSIVPSFFTVGNMFCGFYSVIAAFNGKIAMAAWMIFAGAFLDAMDGKVARFTNSSSQFGVEYDSLADVITFGFAPSVLIYMIFMANLDLVGILFSFLPLLFGSIRLARFNTQLKGFDKSHFSGLPIPIAALTISSFIIFMQYLYQQPDKFPKITFIIILIVSVLMVSTIRYETMPKLNFKGSVKDKFKVVVVIVAAIILVLFPQLVLFPFMLIYILTGIIIWLLRIDPDKILEKDA